MTETDRDEKLARAYRALGAQEPPRALDDAILAAARRRPARWRVPLSVAAVVVLAVGVTLRMLPHEPGTESVALAPQVMETPRPASPPAEPGAATAPGAADVARAPERRAARNEPGATASAGTSKKDQALAEVAGARARGETQAARQAPAPAPAAAGAPPAAAAEAARRDAAMAGAKEQAAERAPAAPAPAAAPAADAPAADAAAPRALGAAKLAEPATPEAWLERIAELKKQGREREAEESLAEFKKRYPGYKIPEALTR
jgi:hypothetical protein